VRKPIESLTLFDTHVHERCPVKLDVCIVLKQDIVGFALRTLELLACELRTVNAPELVNFLSNHNSNVLQTHFVKALVDRWYQLYQGNFKPIAEIQGIS
jgi:hypothetical protein